MAGPRYSIVSWGESAVGYCDPHYCTMSGIGKLNTPMAPYAVANEYICGRLAMMLGLPMPPGLVATMNDGELAYVSLQFGEHEEMLPPVIPSELVHDYPRVASGIVAFDCWVANEDRHEQNVWYSRECPPPMAFDHSHALLGHIKGGAVQRLQDLYDEPCVAGCLAEHISSSDHFSEWAELIGWIPENLVLQLCEDMADMSAISKEEAGAAGQFLLYRQSQILKLLKSDTASFPQVSSWVML
jgi:hypothetical protein